MKPIFGLEKVVRLNIYYDNFCLFILIIEVYKQIKKFHFGDTSTLERLSIMISSVECTFICFLLCKNIEDAIKCSSTTDFRTTVV